LPSYATLYFHTPHALSHISCPTLHCSLLPSFFRFLRDHLDLPSFPTRRSSDLNTGPGAGVEGCPAHSEITSPCVSCRRAAAARTDRKSTRLNSSHVSISYAVFCLKKKKRKLQRGSRQNTQQTHRTTTEVKEYKR